MNVLSLILLFGHWTYNIKSVWTTLFILAWLKHTQCQLDDRRWGPVQDRTMGLCKHQVISVPASNLYDSEVKSHWGNCTVQHQPEKDSVSMFPEDWLWPQMYWCPCHRHHTSSHSPWCFFRGGQVYPPVLHRTLMNSIDCQMSTHCDVTLNICSSAHPQRELTCSSSSPVAHTEA